MQKEWQICYKQSPLVNKLDNKYYSHYIEIISPLITVFCSVSAHCYVLMCPCVQTCELNYHTKRFITMNIDKHSKNNFFYFDNYIMCHLFQSQLCYVRLFMLRQFSVVLQRLPFLFIVISLFRTSCINILKYGEYISPKPPLITQALI